MSDLLPGLGDHAGFIVAAYALAAGVILFLVARAILDHRAQLQALQRLEARGARRRSQRAEAGTEGQP